jgi:predicted RNA-binding protein with PUA-like domain
MKKYWLIKSEPDCYSIEDFKKDKKAAWTGIRNYQARNFMRDGMQVGDGVLFYHSGANPPAVVGTATVASKPHPDMTALDPKDDHYDPKATRENPIWYCVDMAYESTFTDPVTLPQIKFESDLAGIMVAATGSRLSVQPVSEKHFKKILEMGER